MTKILVLGSTGNIGWPLVQILANTTGISVRAGIFNQPTPAMQQLDVDTVKFDFLKADTFGPALQEIDKVFFVRPPQLADPEHDMLPFLKAVKAHRIQQVVFVSLMGVEKNPMVPHRKIEKMIVDLDIPHTFLRPSFFMQNLITSHGEDLKMRHDLFIPAGHARTSFIDCRDIAAAAAVALQDPQYLGQALTLTGPESLTYNQVAEKLSAKLGQTFTYSHPGLLHFRHVMLQRGIKKEFVNVMVMLYVITRLGNAKQTTDTLAKVINRPPLTIENFAMDEVAPFLKTSQNEK
ncbi:NmrA family NAD(P)-binding protein [Secundilactobacillus folii]|uniref:NAD(P)H-binding protein n=1 Tax=Secundilactobacillus folii TaxID=2678357 RepID=A0A7X3C259_9LACO|nr:NmrA family NAD(P)-binding protein [Secundilactobacillus folii]MTV81492.1 NAD(P)H-binding protein [Secundilactobacillus folii]